MNVISVKVKTDFLYIPRIETKDALCRSVMYTPLSHANMHLFSLFFHFSALTNTTEATEASEQCYMCLQRALIKVLLLLYSWPDLFVFPVLFETETAVNY